jgi:hypothetical protein
MIVTIPIIADHGGYPGNLGTFEISDNCPKCGEPRGTIFGILSYDGSRRLNVDGWFNSCGHVDLYSEIVKEGKRVAFKEPTHIGKYSN